MIIDDFKSNNRNNNHHIIKTEDIVVKHIEKKDR